MFFINSLKKSSRKRILGNRGVVLVLTFIIMTVLSIVILSFLSMKAIQVRASAYNTSSTKAFWLAESGLEEYKYLLHTSQKHRDTYPDESDTLGAGNYSVKTTYDGNILYTMTSVGTVDGMTRTVQQSVNVYEVPAVFTKTLYTDGKIQFQACDDFFINGDITAGDTITYDNEEVIIDGEAEENTPLPLPTVDYAYFQVNADSVVAGMTFTPGTYNGLYYSTGGVTIDTGNAGDVININGSIICEADISITGAGIVNFNPAAKRPAMISQKNISSNQDSIMNIYGLVYAEATILFQNKDSTLVNSTIIAGKSIKFQNSGDWTITYDPSILDGIDGLTAPNVGVIYPERDWNEQ